MQSWFHPLEKNDFKWEAVGASDTVGLCTGL